jgi:hypothetical protein
MPLFGGEPLAEVPEAFFHSRALCGRPNLRDEHFLRVPVVIVQQSAQERGRFGMI